MQGGTKAGEAANVNSRLASGVDRRLYQVIVLIVIIMITLPCCRILAIHHALQLLPGLCVPASST